MRFSELNLERYGAFEDCRLTFRDGAPDLHVVYGANEAGKSTTLAAVSDLLFGFGARTPYNFRFDYSLLRVGAVVEADGRRLALRRRKSQAGSLVGPDDRPVDEGPLLAMLKGQSRETFRLAFSLDHLRLREGGRAIVDAKDDLGRAVFAAGSGMTGISAALGALEREADGVWGPRAAARRTYTAAKTVHDESLKQLRAQEIRPKTWSDARKAREEQVVKLQQLEGRRDGLLEEQRRVGRVRLISAAARRREDLFACLEAKSSVPVLMPQTEAAAEAALAAATEGERQRVAAAALLEEAETRAAALDPDIAVLALADRIETAVTQSGADRKAGHDLVRLEEEVRTKRDGITELQGELGMQGATDAAPSRLGVARLRELASAYVSGSSSLRELEQSLRDAEERALPLRQGLADAVVDDVLPALVPAVDTARSLGTDIDARCEAQQNAAERAQAEAQTALMRLNPWVRTVADLAVLPPVAEAEIEAAQAARIRLAEAQEAEAATVARCSEELSRLRLERDTLTVGGQAVPAEALAQSRAGRDERWRGLRAHLIGEKHLPDVAGAGADFERAVAEADTLADHRFVLAEASGQLAGLDARRGKLELELQHARARGEVAAAALVEACQAWSVRLTVAGLPELDPLALRAWLVARIEALAKAAAGDVAREQAQADRRRREQARERLSAFLEPLSSGGEALAPMLERAEQRRREGEARNAAFLADKKTLRGVEEDIAGLHRRLEAAQCGQAETLAEWERERDTLGLELRIEAAEARLAMLEELRELRETVRDLDRRIEGIRRDARNFASEVDELADSLGVSPGEPARRLEVLQQRLNGARAVAEALRELKVAARARREERDRAAAQCDAALADLAPALFQTGVADPAALSEAIQASREVRTLREALAESEQAILAAGDGYAMVDLVEAWRGEDPDRLAVRVDALRDELKTLNAEITEAGVKLGEARRALEALENGPRAAHAMADAQLAKAEMEAQAEAYLLKRTQAVILRWAIERYRERRQNPLLLRAGELFKVLTLGRYTELKVDLDATSPRLLGVLADRASVLEVDAMSEGTVDQLFLALRLAAVEQSIASGVRLPFLADDLFVNFDDDRARAGFRVLAELARSTQVLFFTHHVHLAPIAREVVGADVLSECPLQ